MVPEYPPMSFGNRVMSELNSAYWVAVKETLVRLDMKATKAALAIPAERLSADTTK